MPTWRKILFATLILCVTSATAMARDCVPRSEAESFANADVVFAGQTTGTFTWASRQNTILETSSWRKGNKPKTVVISSYLSNCDVSFVNGYTYIVYAKNLNGELVTSLCSGTAVIGAQVESRREPARFCATYNRDLSYQRVAGITALSVTFSISLGLLVGAIKRRFKK